MPGQAALSRHGDPAPPRKQFYTVDAKLTSASPAADIRALTHLATDAVMAGHGHVLRTDYAVFPNGTVTLVLILAESQLSIHTWPERDMVAIDLCSGGAIDGEQVIERLTGGLQLTAARVKRADQGTCPGR